MPSEYPAAPALRVPLAPRATAARLVPEASGPDLHRRWSGARGRGPWDEARGARFDQTFDLAWARGAEGFSWTKLAAIDHSKSLSVTRASIPVKILRAFLWKRR